jgi:hypothetical protein
MAFVGRDLELSILTTCLGEASARGGRLVWISGEPGIGKTRIAEELSRRAELEGALTVWGRSWEGEGTPPYWLWIQALRRLVDVSPMPDELASWFGDPTRAPADPEQARFRLFDAVSRWLRAVASKRPLVVVLDDLHAGDAATLLLLRFVARDLHGARVLLIGTARDTNNELVANVAREALHVPLSRLQREDVARFIEARAPRLLAQADALFATSEGNPLFVEELLAAATKQPHASKLPTPAGIRGAIRAHLALVSEATLHALETASVFGREAPAAAIDGELGEALRAGILIDAGEQLRFSHVLIRDELYEGIDPDRRRQLHARAVRWFAERRDVLSTIHHCFAAGSVISAADALPLVEEAMRVTRARLAFDDCADLGTRALATWTFADGDACALQIAIGEARTLAGRAAEGKRIGLDAFELAVKLHRGDLMARAALAHEPEHVLGRREDLVTMLRRALAHLDEGDSPLRAEVLSRLGLALIPATPEEGDEPVRLRQEAVAMARRLKMEASLFTALRHAAISGIEYLPATERFAVNAEAIDLARRLGELPRIVTLVGWQVACRIELGDMDGAFAEVRNAEQMLGTFPQPHYGWRAPLIASVPVTLQGRFAESEALAARARALAEQHSLGEAMLHVCVHRIAFQFTRGDAEGYATYAPMVHRLFASTPGSTLFSSFNHALTGNAEGVRNALSGIERMNVDAIPGAAQLGWGVVLCELRDLAGLFYTIASSRLARVPWLFGPSAMSCAGPTALLAGRLAAMIGKRVEAEAHLRAALEIATGVGAAPFVAQAELALAELLSDSSHAARALEIAERLGMTGVAGRARVLVPNSGLAPAASPDRVATVSLVKQGELWVLSQGGRSITLRDAKGFAYLEVLVREPHRDVHVLELVSGDEGDAGPMLDAKAKADYRARAEAIRGDLDEATRNNDRGRIERLQAELEAIGDELSRAVGLGGRDRKAASHAERARINVQRRVRDAVKKVAEADPVLGRHLEFSVKTGVFCVYSPTWPA